MRLRQRYEKEILEFMHIPVMLQEVLAYLRPKANDIFIDGTLGMGGHAKAFLEKIGSGGRFIGLDKDAKALKIAQENLKEFQTPCDFIHSDYCEIDVICQKLNISNVDGILLDVGISSFQIDDARRGFSIKEEGPLDMRMDQDNPLSAYDLVNSLSEKEIAAILKDYGEERYYRSIARRIVDERCKHPIETTKDLERIVFHAIPRRKNWQKIHPATRTFQAFRIAVNKELESLEAALEKCVNLLKPTGRLGVIAFHSLEDRIVKHKFRALARANKARLVFKKPLRATEQEIQKNHRARSACFRVIERVSNEI